MCQTWQNTMNSQGGPETKRTVHTYAHDLKCRLALGLHLLVLINTIQYQCVRDA